MDIKCFLLLLAVLLVNVDCQKCPPQEAILPCRCLSNGKEYQVWCSHSDFPSVLQGLHAIGGHIFEPIDELILESNFLPSLPGRAFPPLKVMRLMLRNNGLERLSSHWLSGLESSLVELFVVEPDLRSFPEDSLMHMERLEAVTIQSNLVKRLPILSNLTRLKYFQMDSVSLLEVTPWSFRNLPQLETIHINNSPRLTKLEASVFEDLPKLNLINISNCGIEWIHPRSITQLPLLKELSLSGNKISDAGMVGRGTRDLAQLEILRLDNNRIDKITEASFVDLPTLKQLYLSNNYISELQYGAFHRVPSLRTLDLNRNRVRRVHPESFLQQSASGLEELWLKHNDIGHVAELRAVLDALPRLIFLDMSHNRLEVIPFGALRGHPTLEHLYLDYNKIHMIDTEAFMAMPALRELRLKNNSLTDLIDGPLWNLPELKGLDLSGNFFRTLRPNLLANLPSLRRIDFFQNQINTIDPATFLMTPLLEHVNLSNNALAMLHPATFRHLLNLYELDVSHNYLMEFVPNLPRGIEYLHMSHNRIQSIPQRPSPDLDLPSLRMLDLSQNGINLIPPKSLKTLPQLRRLYLGRNNLQKLDEFSLNGLSRLELIDFHNNKITQFHPNSLNDMMELREINMKNNYLDILFPEMFRDAPRLKRINFSRNKIAEILPGTLDKNGDLQVLDLSHNYLVQLPETLAGKKELRILDISDNRVKNLNSNLLGSLVELREFKMTNNFVQELKQGAFENLQHLRSIRLDGNALEVIEANAVKLLPVLKTLKLNNNKLKEIPDLAFNTLPTLQAAELQNNQIQRIGNKAFHIVPHLLMLNLSGNHLNTLEEAGLRSLKSLEMLDVSNNKISRVEGQNLEKMEWLVELLMDNNGLCAVHGTPFDGMPRLRVLSMRNNKIMSLPESSFQKLQRNIALLDVDGNPLVCSCSLLWLHSWLQESRLRGPHCSDGTLLKDVRLSRHECPPETRNVEVVAPGCEAELLIAPPPFNAPQVLSLVDSKRNKSEQSRNKLIPPSPEESEYFYDEYVDYPFNETTTGLPTLTTTPGKSSHVIAGDTPIIYAASKNSTIPKVVPNSPSNSGFTFFGVPLPSLNLNKLLGVGGGMRKEDQVVNADRKVGIVNKPQRSGGRGGLTLPTSPDVQKGGFVPLLPGSGGFQPIPNPLTSESVRHNLKTPSEVATSTQSTPNMAEVAKVERITIPPQIEKKIDILQNVTGTTTTTEQPLPEPVIVTSTSTSTSTTSTTTTTPKPSTTVLPVILSTPSVNLEPTSTPLSTVLLPVETEEFKPARRSTITKVMSPHVAASAPLLSSMTVSDIINPQPLREGKNTKELDIITTETSNEPDNSWYFANYNKTNLEPYIGTAEPTDRNTAFSICNNRLFATLLYVHTVLKVL